MTLFSILFMLDYLFTFYGISQGVIREANPLMVWLFQLPFWAGISVRVAFCLLFVLLFAMGKKTRIYTLATKGVNIIYTAVMLLHLSWILKIFSPI